MQAIANEYMTSGLPWPAPARAIAGWAIRQGLWRAQPEDFIDRCADQLARAMRDEYIEDAQGRRVRAKHAVRVEGGPHNLTLWADMRTAPREHMRTAFQQRRMQIVGDCRQLKADVDSYNDNSNPGPRIQMVFDFTNDLAEFEAASGF
jgi:hypothetical protein